MVAVNKQRIVSKTITHLGKLYGGFLPKDLTVLDHLLLGTIQEGTSFSHALAAYKSLLGSFYDLNELRVSHPREVELLLEAVPHRDAKAKHLLDILRFVFETTYAFDLESMRRKPLKRAQKQLSKITGATPFAVAATVQRALGGHALPIDTPMCDILAKLRLISPGELPEQVRTCMEHLVPKSSGVSFCILLSELAADGERQSEIVAEITATRGQRASSSNSSKSDTKSSRTKLDASSSNSQTPADASESPRRVAAARKAVRDRKNR